MDAEEWRRQARKRLLETGFVCGKRILDIGAGPLALIAAKDFGCKVTCIDPDPKELERSRREAAGVQGIEFEQKDATNLSYPDLGFEAVVCYGALHHIPPKKREQALEGMWRVAEQKLVVAEFTQENIKKEHPQDWQAYELVDLSWLEEKLRGFGVLKKYEREVMIYIVLRR